jgi:hypothetical protein
MHIHDMNSTTNSGASARKSRYKDGRQTTTLVLSKELVAASREYFPSTPHGSLSAWADAQLAAFFRKNARKIRAKGITIPPAVFAK